MSDTSKHRWMGCRPFLQHHEAEKRVTCSYCGRSNYYTVVETHHYVKYRAWNDGLRAWLFLFGGFALLIGVIITVITIAIHRTQP